MLTTLHANMSPRHVSGVSQLDRGGDDYGRLSGLCETNIVEDFGLLGSTKSPTPWFLSST